jgi:hypothetical protein
VFDTFDRTGTVEFPFPKKVVFHALTLAVPSIPGMKVEREDRIASRLDVSVGMSAFSWGERVSIAVTSSGPDSSTLGIASGAKTILGSATVHGKNRKNVAQIIARTSDILKDKGADWTAELVAREPPATTPAPTASIADELSKLAALRDQGVLSPVEFEAAKAKLIS